MNKLKKFIAFVMTPILMASVGELLLKSALNAASAANANLGLLDMLTNPMVIFSVGLIIWGIDLACGYVQIRTLIYLSLSKFKLCGNITWLSRVFG